MERPLDLTGIGFAFWPAHRPIHLDQVKDREKVDDR